MQGLKYRDRDYIGAIGAYNNALKSSTTRAILYTGRGASKLKLGDTKGALKDFGKAIQIDATYSAPYFKRRNYW
jgi:Flp pilus assembly protein TadD